MGEPQRAAGIASARGGPNLDRSQAYSSEIEEIARLRERIGEQPVDRSTADALCEGFAACRRMAMDEGDLTLGEIGFSAEVVFAELARRPAALRRSELSFLDNVIALLRERAAAPVAEREDVSLELVGDAFDRLLLRLELSG